MVWLFYTETVFLSAKRRMATILIFEQNKWYTISFFILFFKLDWQLTKGKNCLIHVIGKFINLCVLFLIPASLKFLITSIESWNTLSEKVTDHELLAASWLIHHPSALGSKSIVNDTLFVTFQSNITSRTVFVRTIISVDFCVSSSYHCEEQIQQFHFDTTNLKFAYLW